MIKSSIACGVFAVAFGFVGLMFSAVATLTPAYTLGLTAMMATVGVLWGGMLLDGR